MALRPPLARGVPFSVAWTLLGFTERFGGVDRHRKDVAIAHTEDLAAEHDVEVPDDFIGDVLTAGVGIKLFGHVDLAGRVGIEGVRPDNRVSGRGDRDAGFNVVGTAADDRRDGIVLPKDLRHSAVSVEPVAGGQAANKDVAHQGQSLNARLHSKAGSSRCNSKASMTSRSFSAGSCVFIHRE